MNHIYTKQVPHVFPTHLTHQRSLTRREGLFGHGQMEKENHRRKDVKKKKTAGETQAGRYTPGGGQRKERRQRKKGALMAVVTCSEGENTEKGGGPRHIHLHGSITRGASPFSISTP